MSTGEEGSARRPRRGRAAARARAAAHAARDSARADARHPVAAEGRSSIRCRRRRSSTAMTRELERLRKSTGPILDRAVDLGGRVRGAVLDPVPQLGAQGVRPRLAAPDRRLARRRAALVSAPEQRSTSTSSISSRVDEYRARNEERWSRRRPSEAVRRRRGWSARSSSARSRSSVSSRSSVLHPSVDVQAAALLLVREGERRPADASTPTTAD